MDVKTALDIINETGCIPCPKCKENLCKVNTLAKLSLAPALKPDYSNQNCPLCNMPILDLPKE